MNRLLRILALLVLALLSGRLLLQAGLEFGLGNAAAKRGHALIKKAKDESTRRQAVLGSTPPLAAAPGAAVVSGVTSTSLTANWTANGNLAGTQYVEHVPNIVEKS